MKRVHELRHPTSLTVLSAPSTRSPTLPLCTPAFPTQPSLQSSLLHTIIPPLHPSAHLNIIHPPVHLSRPPPPLQTPGTNASFTNMDVLQMCGLHPTSLHFNPQLHSTSLYSSAVPFHGVSSVQLNPTHHCMRADMQCRQSDASRQAGGRASRQATINAYILARMQGGKAGSRQADKEASRRTCRKAGMQACKHVVFWVFVFFIATKLTFIQVQPWELRIPGDPGTKEPGVPRPSNVGVYMYIYIYTVNCCTQCG